MVRAARYLENAFGCEDRQNTFMRLFYNICYELLIEKNIMVFLFHLSASKYCNVDKIAKYSN